MVQILAYDFDNRLIQIRREDSTLIAEYNYDPFGRRLSKIVEGIATYFYYNEQGLLGEYDFAGAPMQIYGYMPDDLLIAGPIYTRIGSEYYYYLNDHLGTPQKLVGTNGLVQWAVNYSSFGAVMIDSISTTRSNFRLPGQYADQESNLNYNFFRYYDSSIGRYITSDPIGLLGGLNTYLYANANPIKFMDMYGLLPKLPKVPAPGAPTPLTCMVNGEDCRIRAARGVVECMARRGLGVGSYTCKEEWHSWFLDCVTSGGQMCDEPDDEQASCPFQFPTTA
jgi:RHS repeat-associated protein